MTLPRDFLEGALRRDGEQRHVHDRGAQDHAERDDEAYLAERIVRAEQTVARSQGVSARPIAPTNIAGMPIRTPTIIPAPRVDEEKPVAAIGAT